MKKNIVIIITVLLIVIAGFLSIKPIKKKLAHKSFEEGIELHGLNNYSEARSAFKKAIDLNEGYIEAFINLAKTELSLDSLNAALTTAQKGLKIDGNNAELHIVCGEVFIKNAAFKKSIESFNKAITNDSTIAPAFYYRGVAQANLGELSLALNDYKKAQALDKSNAEYYESSALIRTKLEDYKGIIKDYNKIIELDPSNAEALYQRGYFKFNLDDYEGAITDFDNVLKINNQSGKAYYYKGLALTKTHEFNKAASCFNLAANNGFKPDEALFNEGLAYLQTNNTQAASKAFKSSLKTNNTGDKAKEARLNLGVIEMMNGNMPKALNTFNSILENDNKNTGALFNRAYIYGSSAKYNEAINDLSRCIELGDKSAKVYYLRAAYYISINENGLGCADAKIAKELGHPEADNLIKMYCNK